MSSENRQYPHWTAIFSAIQVLSTIFLVFIFYKFVDEQNTREEKWFYFMLANICTVITLIINVSLHSENFIRQVVSSLSLILFTFLLPLTLVSLGLPPSNAILAGMVFSTLVICACSIHVAILAFLTGALFSLKFPSYTGISMDSVYPSMIAYFALSGVALLWRSLIIKLIQGYLHLNDRDPGDASRFETKIKDLESERDNLRDELITHIVELNEAVLSHQPDKQEGK